MATGSGGAGGSSDSHPVMLPSPPARKHAQRRCLPGRKEGTCHSAMGGGRARRRAAAPQPRQNRHCARVRSVAGASLRACEAQRALRAAHRAGRQQQHVGWPRRSPPTASVKLQGAAKELARCRRVGNSVSAGVAARPYGGRPLRCWRHALKALKGMKVYAELGAVRCIAGAPGRSALHAAAGVCFARRGSTFLAACPREPSQRLPSHSSPPTRFFALRERLQGRRPEPGRAGGACKQPPAGGRPTDGSAAPPAAVGEPSHPTAGVHRVQASCHASLQEMACQPAVNLGQGNPYKPVPG